MQEVYFFAMVRIIKGKKKARMSVGYIISVYTKYSYKFYHCIKMFRKGMESLLYLSLKYYVNQ